MELFHPDARSCNLSKTVARSYTIVAAAAYWSDFSQSDVTMCDFTILKWFNYSTKCAKEWQVEGHSEIMASLKSLTGSNCVNLTSEMEHSNHLTVQFADGSTDSDIALMTISHIVSGIVMSNYKWVTSTFFLQCLWWPSFPSDLPDLFLHPHLNFRFSEHDWT